MSDVMHPTPTVDQPNHRSSTAAAASGIPGHDGPETRAVRGSIGLAPAATRPSGHRSSAARWLTAILTTALMLVGTLGIAAFAETGRAGAGASPSFLPEDAIAYAEARLDLPGDQREQLLAFLANVPGFADPASFDSKIDGVLEGILGGDDSQISWAEDIKPWFGGQLMFGLTELPDMTALSGMASGSGDPQAIPGIIALGVTDRAALDAVVAELTAGMGDAVQAEPYRDTTVYQSADGAVTAFAPTDEMLLLGSDVDQIKASIDLLAGEGASLADDADYQAAMARVPTDRLAAFYVDGGQLRESLAPWLESQLEQVPVPGLSEAMFEGLLGSLPESITGALRVDADHLTASLDAVPGPATPELSMRETDLADWFGADTLAYVEARDLGWALDGVITQLMPLIEQGMTQGAGGQLDLSQLEKLLGGSLDEWFDWLGDAGIGVSVGAAGPSLGLVATVTDEASAKVHVNALLSLVNLISLGKDAPVDVAETTVDGVTVTTITLTDTTAMGELPIEPELSVALDGDHLLLGMGDFVTDALGRDAADSLASSDRFQRALTAAGTPHAGLIFVDVASAFGFVGQLMGSDSREQYEAQVAPFLGTVDFVVGELGQDDETISADLMVFVK